MTSMNQIAREIGVHRSTVMRRIRRGADPFEGSAHAGVPKRSGRSVPVDPVDADVIRNGVASGLTNAEIAREMGVSRMTVYRRGDKIGIDMRRGFHHQADTLRRAVQEMSRDEAIEYLLEVVEQIVAQDEPLQRRVGDATLTPQQAIIFAILKRYLGEEVSRERIWHAIAAGRPDTGPDIKSVDVQICVMRKLLHGQYRIETIWAFGYRMEAVA